MVKRPLSVTIAWIFILLNALIWVAFGLLVAAHAHPALPDQPVIQGLMAFLSFAAAAVLLGALILLRKHNRWAYFLAIAFFAAASILTIFDQFGLIDLAVLLINLVPIALLLKDRNWYLHPA
jgi:hypothetical protein